MQKIRKPSWLKISIASNDIVTLKIDTHSQYTVLWTMSHLGGWPKEQLHL